MSKTQPPPISWNYPRVSPLLCVAGAAAAMGFHSEVFGATQRMGIATPGGKVGDAEIQSGDSVIIASDEPPEMGVHGPGAFGGTTVMLGVNVQDVDAMFARAVAAGATVVRSVEDRLHGDRSGQFADPWAPV